MSIISFHYIQMLSVLETEIAQMLACLFSKPRVTDLTDKSNSLSDSINWGLVDVYYLIVSWLLNHDLFKATLK